MIRFLCNAEKSQENIGIFCFRNNIETELHLPQLNTAKMAEITGALRKDAAEMKQSPTIVEIQKFVDTITKNIKDYGKIYFKKIFGESECSDY